MHGRFFALSLNGMLYFNFDGADWEKWRLGEAAYIRDIVGNADGYAVATLNTGTLYYSIDLQHWQATYQSDHRLE